MAKADLTLSIRAWQKSWELALKDIEIKVLQDEIARLEDEVDLWVNSLADQTLKNMEMERRLAWYRRIAVNVHGEAAVKREELKRDHRFNGEG